MADAIPEVCVTPFQIALHLLGIGIEEQLVWIETRTVRGIVGAVHPIAIPQSRARFGQIAVPDLVGLLGYGYAVDFTTSARIVQAEFHFVGVFRK